MVSAVFVIGVGLYAITTFNLVTQLVGIGGLAVGILFFRPRRYAARCSAHQARMSSRHRGGESRFLATGNGRPYRNRHHRDAAAGPSRPQTTSA